MSDTLPYGVMADLHAHAWTQFSRVDAKGVNTRLRAILREVDRCCETVLEAGGHTVVIAGDLFHVRGSVAPSVFNPVRECIRGWQTREDITFHIIPGNHDLESKDSRTLTSAVAMLGDAALIYHDAETCWFSANSPRLAFVPWHEKQSELLKAIDELRSRDLELAEHSDLFIHAGIDGVLDGMPDHGLTAKVLFDRGFSRVFAGHYHNHKALGQEVYSIGAPTHQTWSDVGSKAGWLIVTDNDVKWHASHAPSFVQIEAGDDEETLFSKVDGNFVRAKLGRVTAAEVQAWRDKLQEMGALGTVIESTPAPVAVRGATLGGLASLPDAVANYCAQSGAEAWVTDRCITILSEIAA